MSRELLYQIVTLLRLVAFMVVFYLAFGLLVERVSRKPESQLKAFARVVCSPITRPVARRLAPGTAYTRVLAVSIAVVAVVWALAVVAARALRPAA
jgi:hypothetical protein